VREFLPNALDAAKREEGRLVVWVQDPAVMTLDRVEDLFRDDDEILAAVVTANRRIAGWVFRDRIGVDDAEFAFRQAG
jgi:hypothetical protein